MFDSSPSNTASQQGRRVTPQKSPSKKKSGIRRASSNASIGSSGSAENKDDSVRNAANLSSQHTPPPSSPSQNAQSEAEKLKKVGNDFHKKGVFDEATEFYTKSIALDPTYPVYFSNRSASLFEFGRYIEAVNDGMKSLMMRCGVTGEELGTGKGENDSNVAEARKKLAAVALDQPAVFKRIVKAASFAGQYEKLEYLPVDQELRRFLDALQDRTRNANPLRGEEGLTPLYRLMVCDLTYCEYFSIGHDPAVSAFADYVDSIENKKHLWEKLNTGKAPPNATVKILCNDLNPTALARLVILFLALEEMSKFSTPDRSNPDFAFLLTYISMTYYCIGLHPDVSKKLEKVLRACARSTAWMERLPFIRFSDDKTKSAVQDVFKLWLSKMNKMN
ncbi:hypothetical protein HK102_006890 [Quaeritorhiza haematococci]|nr:hypothetical protein HK102_006890 [Quaeritorhiza haematococci]